MQIYTALYVVVTGVSAAEPRAKRRLPLSKQDENSRSSFTTTIGPHLRSWDKTTFLTKV